MSWEIEFVVAVMTRFLLLSAYIIEGIWNNNDRGDILSNIAHIDINASTYINGFIVVSFRIKEGKVDLNGFMS